MSSSPRLSNTEVFPRFLRTVSSDAEIVVGIIQIMKQFGWSRMALITQSENIFTFVSVHITSHCYVDRLSVTRVNKIHSTKVF